MNKFSLQDNSISDNTSFHDSQKKYHLNSNQQEQNTKQELNKKDIKKSVNVVEDKNVIDNKITNKQINDQFNQIQDDQNVNSEKFRESGDFCSINQYDMVTQNKGKNKNQNFQQNEQREHIDCIFNNQYSIVDLKFDFPLNKFVVTKENKGEKEVFEQECKILKYLKGSNITLDIISANNDNSKFQQIAGKINFNSLKKKIGNIRIFEQYYLILLDKLQRMHEKGIAHSDIKPSNIVISYQNEPYFIDFGGSINLSNQINYQHYLKQHTPMFNLDIYLDKQFEDKEEIKLCDKTQLSITFLYLLSQYQQQLQLFKTKNYNQLIKDLLNNTDWLILSIISRILNEADPSINIIDCRIEQFQTIYSHYEMQNVQGIILEQQVFIIKEIDKFNIKLIYFLDKMNCILDIQPKRIPINFFPDMMEFKYISEKYKINKYFEKYIDSSYQLLDQYKMQDLLNIFEYVRVYQIERIQIQIKAVWHQFEIIFETISILNSQTSLEMIIIFDSKELNYFIECLKEYQTWFIYAESFQIIQDRIVCKVIKTKNENQNQQPNIYLEFHILQYCLENDIHQLINVVQNNYKIEQNQIICRSFYTHNDMINDDFFINYLKENILSHSNQQMFYFEKTLFTSKKYYINYEGIIDHISEKKFRYYNKCQQHEMYSQFYLNRFIKNIYKQQQSDIICTQCQSIISSIKQDMSIQVEQFTQKILQFENPKYKIIIKIKDYIFEQIELWKKIYSIIKTNKNNFYYELILVNCQFSKEVDNILKEIQPIYNYQEKSIDKNMEQDENNDDFLKFSFSIQNNLKEYKGLKIILINEYISKQSYRKENEGGQKQIINDENNGKNENELGNKYEIIKNQIQNENKYVFLSYNIDLSQDNQIYETDKKLQKIIKDESNISKVYEIFEKQKDLICELNELRIEYKSYKQNIQFFKTYEKKCNKENIDQLIQHINNKQIITFINLHSESNQQFWMALRVRNIYLYISCDNLDIEAFNQLKELYYTIYMNYYQLKPHFHIDLPQRTYFKIEYNDLSITENIYSKNIDNNIYDILSFFEIDINSNETFYSQNQPFFVSHETININNINIYSANVIDKLNDFQKQSSIFNLSLLFQQNKLPVIQITFYLFEIEDKLKFLLEEIEKMFSQNIFYSFIVDKAETLYQMYEVIKNCLKKQKIYFDLAYCYKYCDLKQFIKKIKLDNLIECDFEIEMENDEIKRQIIEDFQDIFEISHIKQQIIQLKQPKSFSNQIQIIKMRFQYSDFNLFL